MIRSFKHKGLRKFFETGSRAGISSEHTARLARILDRLDAAIGPLDMDLPGYRLHELSGGERGTWSVSVSGNWRVTFAFEGEDAARVDYRDHH